MGATKRVSGWFHPTESVVGTRIDCDAWSRACLISSPTHQQGNREEKPRAPNLVRGQPVHRPLRRPYRHHQRQIPDAIESVVRNTRCTLQHSRRKTQRDRTHEGASSMSIRHIGPQSRTRGHACRSPPSKTNTADGQTTKKNKNKVTHNVQALQVPKQGTTRTRCESRDQAKNGMGAKNNNHVNTRALWGSTDSQAVLSSRCRVRSTHRDPLLTRRGKIG